MPRARSSSRRRPRLGGRGEPPRTKTIRSPASSSWRCTHSPRRLSGATGAGIVSGAEIAARARERGAHARDLALREHEHRRVVDVVHVVHEEIAVRAVPAGDVWKGRRSVVLVELRRRVGDEVVVLAGRDAALAPDVAQVQVVPHLVRRGAAEVEGLPGASARAEGRVQDRDAVRLLRAAGELRVAERPAFEVADPDVQVPLRVPRRDAPRARVLHVVARGAEAPPGGALALDSARRLPGRGPRGEPELDAGVRHERPERGGHARAVRVPLAVVEVQALDLAPHLRIGHLRRRAQHDVDDDGDADHAAPQRLPPLETRAREALDLGLARARLGVAVEEREVRLEAAAAAPPRGKALRLRARGPGGALPCHQDPPPRSTSTGADSRRSPGFFRFLAAPRDGTLRSVEAKRPPGAAFQPDPARYRMLARAAAAARRRYLGFANVLDVGVGLKFRSGRLVGLAPCVQFCVRRKVRRPGAHRLPRFVHARWRDGRVDRGRRIPTDVVVVRTPRFACGAGTRLEAPGEFGTLTLLFRNRPDAGYYLLTCAHVAGSLDLSPPSDPRLESECCPAAPFAITVANGVAERGEVDFDVALARLEPACTPLPVRRVEGSRTRLRRLRPAAEILPGARVECAAARSGAFSGTVASDARALRVRLDGTAYLVRNLHLIQARLLPGDSGGLVFDGEEAIGILVALAGDDAPGHVGWGLFQPLEGAIGHLADRCGFPLRPFE